MASTWFSLLLLLLLASRRAFVFAQQAQTHVLGKNVQAQYSVRLPRGLLDGLVGALIGPTSGTEGNDCSNARGDSVNIGATLPLGISAGISGSSASAHSRQGCGAGAESSPGGVNSGSDSAASAGGAARSGTPPQIGHGPESHDGQGHRQHGFSSGGEVIPSGSSETGVGWESQSGSHAVSGSAGQSRPKGTSNGPGNGNGFTNSGGFVRGAPIQGETPSVSESWSQSVSASTGQGGSVGGEYWQGNSRDTFGGCDGGHVHKLGGCGVGSPDAEGTGKDNGANSLNPGGGSGAVVGILSSSSSTSRASSSAGNSAGARPAAAHSSSRSDASSSSQSNSLVINT